MCKLGDIILVNEFKNEDGEIVAKHSFVVINDEKHKNKKLRYKTNFPIKEKMISGKKINEKEGFIKAEQLYYFDH